MRRAFLRLLVPTAGLAVAALAVPSTAHAASNDPHVDEVASAPATDGPTSTPVVVVSSSAAVVGTGLAVAGIVQADDDEHPLLAGAGVGALLVAVPAVAASLAADDPSTMEDPGLAAAGVGAMALGASAVGTGVIAVGGAGDDVAGPALLVAGGVTLTGGVVLTALGARDNPWRAAEREKIAPAPVLAPGERTTAGDVGVGLVVTGLVLLPIGCVTAAGGALMDDKLSGAGVAIGGGGVAGLGVILATVGGAMWSSGTAAPPPVVSVGPGSIDVRGAF